jgi:hypothetical protein
MLACGLIPIFHVTYFEKNLIVIFESLIFLTCRLLGHVVDPTKKLNLPHRIDICGDMLCGSTYMAPSVHYDENCPI